MVYYERGERMNSSLVYLKFSPPPTLQPLSEKRKKRERTESLTHEMFCHVKY